MDSAHLTSINDDAFSELIPIFPLPNVVLLPRAVLPLHVFEERYRVMTRDALNGPRLVAMALLQPGYESTYHTASAAIHPMVCVGRILREERLADGRYNFLLHGLCRARVLSEDTQRPYRRGEMERVETTALHADEECAARRRLRAILTDSSLAPAAREARWIDLLACTEISFSDLVDVLAAAVLSGPEQKQEFLSELRTDRRALRLCSILTRLSLATDSPQGRGHKARSWPPTFCAN